METLRTYRACERASGVRPGPEEADAIALGKFVPTAPAACRAFRYTLRVGAAAAGVCLLLPHRVVAFVGPGDGPPQDAEPRAIKVVPEVEGVQEIVLDPPLAVGAGQAAYLGVTMAALSDYEWSCLGTCRGVSMADRSFWSEQPWTSPPPESWGWERLSESPTPDTGLQEDLQLELDCTPI